MAGDEHEPEQVIADLIVERVHVGRKFRCRLFELLFYLA
jgi:hypothetical protein